MPDENVAFAMLARGEVPPENPFAKNDKGRVGKCKYADLFGTPAKSAFRSFGDIDHMNNITFCSITSHTWRILQTITAMLKLWRTV